MWAKLCVPGEAAQIRPSDPSPCQAVRMCVLEQAQDVVKQLPIQECVAAALV